MTHDHVHPVFAEILNVFGPKPVAAYTLAAAVDEADMHAAKHADRFGDPAANAAEPDRERIEAIKERARQRLRETIEEIDARHPKTPPTRIPGQGAD